MTARKLGEGPMRNSLIASAGGTGYSKVTGPRRAGGWTASGDPIPSFRFRWPRSAAVDQRRQPGCGAARAEEEPTALPMLIAWPH